MMVRARRLILALAVLLAVAPSWGAVEDPGPFPVGWREVGFVDEIFGQGYIDGRLYYPATEAARAAPADPSAGPYPVVAFQHGYLGRPSNYDDLCTHLASWGFVVASTGTATGLFPNHPQYARDTRSFLHWVEAESADPGSWLAGMAWDGDWAAAGHSMGGGVLHLLIGIEPRVRTILGLQAAQEPDAAARANLEAFTGNAFYVAGSVDNIVPQGVVRRWYDGATAARRSSFHVVEGMGHTGCLDDPSTGEPLPGPEQHRLHRRLVAGYLRAEMLGQEDLYAEILGEGMAAEPVAREVTFLEPATWGGESVLAPGALLFGLAALPGDRARLLASRAPASISTPFGILGVDPDQGGVLRDSPAGPDGVIEWAVAVPPGWSGVTAYAQGLATRAGQGSLGRTLEATLP